MSADHADDSDSVPVSRDLEGVPHPSFWIDVHVLAVVFVFSTIELASPSLVVLTPSRRRQQSRK
jgi:hypothetical protein